VCVREIWKAKETQWINTAREKSKKGFLARSSHTQSNLGVLQSFSEYSGAGRLGTEKAFKAMRLKEVSVLM
jgi:hypothetical protein